ncbi:MAG: SCO family protein [Bacteroidota bacterium]
MRKSIKTGILVAVLLVPVFLVFGLKFFGRNHYELRRMPNKEKFLTGEDGSIKSIPAFSLTDQDGKTFTQEQLKGKVVIADFIFSRCETICPKMTHELTRLQETFAGNKDVIIISHTVDPEFDSAAVLNSYAAQYGAKYGQWYFLTGPKPVIYGLARDGYFLPVGKGDGGETDFIHSDKVVLADKKGRIRGFYNGTDPVMVDTLILETRILLQEQDNNGE